MVSAWLWCQVLTSFEPKVLSVSTLRGHPRPRIMTSKYCCTCEQISTMPGIIIYLNYYLNVKETAARDSEKSCRIQWHSRVYVYFTHSWAQFEPSPGVLIGVQPTINYLMIQCQVSTDTVPHWLYFICKFKVHSKSVSCLHFEMKAGGRPLPCLPSFPLFGTQPVKAVKKHNFLRPFLGLLCLNGNIWLWRNCNENILQSKAAISKLHPKKNCKTGVYKL